MENRYNDNDFEQFVKQNADKYRMFPSEQVWKGIHNTLHTRSRWYGIGLGLLILTTGVVSWVMLSNSERNTQVVSTLPEITARQTTVNNIQNAEIITVPAKTPSNKTSFITPADNLEKTLFISRKTAETVFTSSPDDNRNSNQLMAHNNVIPVNKVENADQTELILKTNPAGKQIGSIKPLKTNLNPINISKFSFSPNRNNITIYSDLKKNEENIVIKKGNIPVNKEKAIPFYTNLQRRKKVSLQVYFTPSISYRQLKENKDFINSAQTTTSPGITYYATDINNIVTHKPDIGFQMGFMAGYPLSKKFRLIGGLQFNISKYDIRAYTHPSEVTTIALRNTAGGTNTVSTVTNYRSRYTGGANADWLHNLYFSASAPIGLEFKFNEKKKNYLGISGTVQPTYLLRNKAYLLSTDYKNYAEVPSLSRKWNINTSFELFAGNTTGKIKWRVGPMVRYQAMSSFIKKYPVQEHLFDFGLKMGVMLNK